MTSSAGCAKKERLEILTDYAGTLRSFNRDTRLFLFVSMLVGFTIFPGVPAVLLNLYLLRLGYEPQFIGMTNGLASLGYALSCLPSAVMGNRWGIRRMMVAGLFACMIGYGVLPLAAAIPVGLRGAWIIGIRLMTSFGSALYFVNFRPFLMAISSPEERTHVFSVRSALQPVGAFFGSLVAGLLPGLLAGVLGLTLGDSLPYGLPISLSALMLLPALWAMKRTRDVTIERPKHDPTTIARKGDIPLAIISLLAMVGFLRAAGQGATGAYLNVYLDTILRMPTSTIGVLSAAGQLLGIAFALGTPLLAARWGNVSTYVIANMGSVLGLLLIAFIPHPIAAGVGTVAVGALSAIAIPIMNLYQMEVVTPYWRATMAGGVSMAMGISRALLGLGGALLLGVGGYSGVFTLSGVLMAAGACLFGISSRRRRTTR